MSDRPIVFSTPMVQAILRELAEPGSGKTQTRRMITPQPDFNPISGYYHVHSRLGGVMMVAEADVAREQLDYLTPPWEPGDRAWVRETWRTGALYDETKPSDLREGAFLHYEADGSEDKRTGVGLNGLYAYGRLRTSRYMMRWMSRITLHITDVRVMRLQDTSEADALAEGIVQRPVKGAPEGVVEYHIPGVDHTNKDFPYLSRPTAREMYAALMDTLHESGFWASNPWVYALTFVPELAHIDNARRSA